MSKSSELVHIQKIIEENIKTLEEQPFQILNEQKIESLTPVSFTTILYLTFPLSTKKLIQLTNTFCYQ